MKMPQRTNEMNCETSPSRRHWPPLDRRDPAPASSKALVTFWINKRLFACPHLPSTSHPDVRASSSLGRAAGLPTAGAGMQRDWLAPRSDGLPSLLQTPGEAAGQGERKKNLSCFLAARHPSALQHLNDITTLPVSRFKPLVEAGRASCRARLAFAAMLCPIPLL